MAAQICQGCDFYQPQSQQKIGRECAALPKCVRVNACGIRIPPLPRDANGRQIVKETNEEEPQAIAEVRSIT